MAQVYAFTDQNGETRLFAQIHPDPQPKSGSFLPVADATGVTVDTTTYTNPVTGSGKITTLIFPSESVVLAVAQAGDAFPQYVLTSEGDDALWIGDGTFDAYSSGAGLTNAGAGGLSVAGTLGVHAATQAGQAPRLSQVSPALTINGGALPTVDFTGQTGVGKQIDTTRDVDIYVETGTAGSVVAALSPDNTTYTTIYTKTMLATDVCHARVPAGWYLKLTATTAVLGVGTYA